MVNEEFLDAIMSLVAHCGLCDLNTNGKALPFIGLEPKAILLGEAPGQDEIVERKPFVGRSGKYMFDVIDSMGFTRDNFVIVNTVQCRPVVHKGNKILNGKPKPTEMKLCEPFVEAILFGSGLPKVMCLGAYPKTWVANYTKNKDFGKISITKAVGTSMTINKMRPLNKICKETIEATFNYHPAATLYDSNKKEIFENTFRDFLSSL